MKTLAIWVDKLYQEDELFNPHSKLNRDDCLSKYRLLKIYLERSGWEVHTQDFFSIKSPPHSILFTEIPARKIEFLLKRWKRRKKIVTHVVLSECEVVEPRNWINELHRQFDSIFTWRRDLVDGSRYFNINFVTSRTEMKKVEWSEKHKLCTMIAGNKTSKHPLELYSKRVEAIRWFESNHPSDFDLYGVGWGGYVHSGSKWVRIVTRNKWLNKLLFKPYSSYRGAVENKFETLAKYKFAICFENATSIPDYITEKIFDCFASGCVPIYLGAPNISERVPKGCFIDAREYTSYEQLYKYLIGVNSSSYDVYIRNIQNYMRSRSFMEHKKESFAKSIQERVVSGT